MWQLYFNKAGRVDYKEEEEEAEEGGKEGFME